MDPVLRKLRSLNAAAGHIAWLDGWRGLCITMVLIGHFLPHYLGHAAQLGVEMFFVLSGRLMAELLIVRRQSLATFVVRRASRVVPLVALYTAIISIGLAAASLVAGAKVNWLSPIASLFFFSNYLSAPEPLLEHTWSLAVEEHSYLLLVLVAIWSARMPALAGRIAFALACCMILNGFLLYHDGVQTGAYVFWRSDVRGASVLLSFALYLSWGQRPPAFLGRALAWLSPACLVAAAACMIPGDPVTPLQMTACTLFAAVSVNTIQFASARFRQLLSLRTLTWLGALSFSLYIWQQPLFIATKGGLPAAMALPFVFLCAVWSYFRIEGPARRYLNRRWEETRATPSARAEVPQG